MVDLHDIYILLESKGYIVNRIVSEEGNVYRFASQQRYDFENGIVHFLKITHYAYYEEKFKVEIEDVKLYRDDEKPIKKIKVLKKNPMWYPNESK